MKKFTEVLIRFLPILAISIVLYFYMLNFAPYRTDGSLYDVHILVVLSLVSAAIFLLCRFLAFFVWPKSASKIALILSLVIIQVLLLGGDVNTLSGNSLLIIAGLNVFLLVGALKVL